MHLLLVLEVPGSNPVRQGLLCLFFCFFDDFTFSPKTHYLSHNFTIPFSMLNYLVSTYYIFNKIMVLFHMIKMNLNFHTPDTNFVQ